MADQDNNTIISAALEACSLQVKKDSNGDPIRQAVHDCMKGRGYSVLYNGGDCYGRVPQDAQGRRDLQALDYCLRYERENSLLSNNSTVKETYIPTPPPPPPNPAPFDFSTKADVK